MPLITVWVAHVEVVTAVVPTAMDVVEDEVVDIVGALCTVATTTLVSPVALFTSSSSSSSLDEVEDRDEKEEVEVALIEIVGDGARLGGVVAGVEDVDLATDFRAGVDIVLFLLGVAGLDLTGVDGVDLMEANALDFSGVAGLDLVGVGGLPTGGRLLVGVAGWCSFLGVAESTSFIWEW